MVHTKVLPREWTLGYSSSVGSGCWIDGTVFTYCAKVSGNNNNNDRYELSRNGEPVRVAMKFVKIVPSESDIVQCISFDIQPSLRPQRTIQKGKKQFLTSSLRFTAVKHSQIVKSYRMGVILDVRAFSETISHLQYLYLLRPTY